MGSWSDRAQRQAAEPAVRLPKTGPATALKGATQRRPQRQPHARSRRSPRAQQRRCTVVSAARSETCRSRRPVVLLRGRCAGGQPTQRQCRHSDQPGARPARSRAANLTATRVAAVQRRTQDCAVVVARNVDRAEGVGRTNAAPGHQPGDAGARFSPTAALQQRTCTRRRGAAHGPVAGPHRNRGRPRGLHQAGVTATTWRPAGAATVVHPAVAVRRSRLQPEGHCRDPGW